MEYSTERRLTCNRIFRHLMFYHFIKFTGKVKVYGKHHEKVWNFYFFYGDLTWAYEPEYASQRWRRQILDVTGEKPQLDKIDWNAECSDCRQLRILTQQNELAPYQIKRIIRGTLEEVLFDVVQAFEAPVYEAISYSNLKTLPSLSQLVGIGDGMELEAEEGVHPDRYYRLPYRFFPTLKSLQETTFQTWKQWAQMKLFQFSPNEAPLLVEPEKLKPLVSEKIYQNMLIVLRGKKSLRDLAFQFKHNRNFLKLGTILSPYIQKKLIEFKEVNDLYIKRTLTEMGVTLPQTPSKEALLLVVDSNQERQEILSAIAQEQGYKVKVIPNSLDAVHQLFNNPKLNPHLIFTADQMPVITAVEFCSIIRRLDSLKNVPILIYANLFKLKKHSRDLFRAGATELIDDNLFTSYHLRSILGMYAGLNPTQTDRQSEDTHSEAPTLTIQGVLNQVPFSNSLS